jgi:hypothetical protein
LQDALPLLEHHRLLLWHIGAVVAVAALAVHAWCTAASSITQQAATHQLEEVVFVVYL